MTEPAWLTRARAEGRIVERGVRGKALADGETQRPVKLCQRRPKGMIEPRWAFELTLPIQVVAEANKREHWSKKHRRFKTQRCVVYCAWLSWRIPRQCYPAKITLTHLGPTMDTDNLAGSFKGVRDEVAKLIGLDDGDARLTWEYRQEPSKLCGVRVRIEKT